MFLKQNLLLKDFYDNSNEGGNNLNLNDMSLTFGTKIENFDINA